MGGTKFYRFKTPCFGGFAGSDSRNECIVGSILCEKGSYRGANGIEVGRPGEEGERQTSDRPEARDTQG